MTFLRKRNSLSGSRAVAHGSRSRSVLTLVATASVGSLALITAFAPATPESSQAFGVDGFVAQASGDRFRDAQSVRVTDELVVASFSRDGYSVASGVETVATTGTTNKDWAKLVLLMGKFPVSESNVTVMMRWMRQENGTNNWWNRNNPLNNGWGSGGGSGLGSYDTLVIAAENAAKALHGNPGYASIVAGFSASAPTAQIESAIWASPWATSHYGNGTHWSQSPVPEVTSPSGTW